MQREAATRFRRLVRGRRLAPPVGPNLGNHEALGPMAVAHEDVLAGAKLLEDVLGMRDLLPIDPRVTKATQATE